MSENREKPIQRLRYGSVTAAIWRNSGDAGSFYSVTFNRLFKDGERWRESRSFNDRDLSNLTKVASDAHAWIVREEEESQKRLSTASLPQVPLAEARIEPEENVS